MFLTGGPGCRVVETEVVHQIEVETSEREYRDVAGEEGQSPGAGRQAVFRLGARQRLWIAAGRLKVEIRAVEVAGGEGSSQEVNRWTARQFYDFENGEAWMSDSGGPFSFYQLRELAYRSDNTRRNNEIDFVDRYVRLPEVRDFEGIDTYAGDLNVVPKGRRNRGKQNLQAAVEPGVSWEVTVDPSDESDAFRWVRGVLIYHLTRQTLERSLQIAKSLRGTPLELTGRTMPGGEAEVVIQHKVMSLRQLRKERDFFAPPAADRDYARELEDELRDAASLLSLLRRPEERPDGVTPLALILRLEDRVREEDDLVGRVLALWKETPVSDPWGQATLGAMHVELLRIALRLDSESTSPFLREVVRREESARARAAAEALIAEAHPEASEAVLDLVQRRRQFLVPQEVLIAWGVRRLRVLSGLSLDDLVRAISAYWLPLATLPLGSDAFFEAVPEALALELDFWLRWAEQQGRR